MSEKFKSKIIKVNTKKNYDLFKKINNNYFITDTNKENLSFIIEISKKLKLKRYLLLKTIQKFKGLKYRQQTIFKNNSLTIINDSKSTSFSSSIGVLKSNSNILWLLGGIHKKGDRLHLKKKILKMLELSFMEKIKNFLIKSLKIRLNFKILIN